jgi:hypothetical protein
VKIIDVRLQSADGELWVAYVERPGTHRNLRASALKAALQRCLCSSTVVLRSYREYVRSAFNVVEHNTAESTRDWCEAMRKRRVPQINVLQCMRNMNQASTTFAAVPLTVERQTHTEEDEDLSLWSDDSADA